MNTRSYIGAGLSTAKLDIEYLQIRRIVGDLEFNCDAMLPAAAMITTQIVNATGRYRPNAERGCVICEVT